MSRQLPQSQESEKALLGSILLKPTEVLSLCIERGITVSHFHNPPHAIIFAVALAMWKENEPIDLVTLTQKLISKNELRDVGGAAYLSDLFTFIPTSANAENYAGILVDMFTLRQLIAKCTEFAARAHVEFENATGLVNECLLAISGAAVTRNTKEKSLKEMLFEKLERMEADPTTLLISTGLSKLDDVSPLRFGDMPLIAGERKSGKSLLSLTIARNVAIAGWRVLYFSLEDRYSKGIDRLCAAITRIPINRHHKSKLNDMESARFGPAIMSLAETDLIIRDDVRELAEIVAVMRQTKARHPDLALVVIDYAQLVRNARVNKNDSREQEVANVSRTIRLLAIELNCAVLLLSQLNKDLVSRESSALENDATAMWRIDKIPDKTAKESEGDKFLDNERMLVIPWQRDGESGLCFKISFFGATARVENYAHDPQ